ncbi:two component LuxR family transcriptional regulator [Sulfobacillus acidophilus TPY]|uniref:Stage 0 sporulation protein A homolog n=1 Tax=Sulfobacillus acidophilus (strain ATCC 700253 / DSM 10332 / NAL) TaxID=679936 RepID=G8TW12_SULAD|nr:two component LuxR family transcriptional regulator [Sulfobacillus acidophilus TPY]AEW05939.1 two component transcriptional regulator, LuxR family [Sulfobacillus acidophilus DSM 10332]
MSGGIRVGVLDDHPVVREGLRALLAATGNMDVVFDAASGDEALKYLTRTACDVLLLDWMLPAPWTGDAVFREVRQRWPALRVVVLTSYSALDIQERLVTEGAAGFLEKTVTPDGLLSAIRHAAEGRTVWTGSRRDLSGPALTPRELDVLGRLAQGLANKEIAQALGITEKTVKVHVAHIFGKLGVNDRTQAVIAAHQRGLVHLDRNPG